MQFDAAADLTRQAVSRGVFPAAVAEVGRGPEVLWREAFGALSYDPGAPSATSDTVFDLASLTKVVATTTLGMRLVEEGRLSLEDPVRAWLPEWRGADRVDVTIRDLLAHASGLTAHLPLFRDYAGRIEYQPAICDLPLEYPPRSQSIYSDLGFILLGFILEDAGRAPLDEQFARLVVEWRLEEVQYRPPREWRSRIAPTEIDTWRGRLIVGEVHDENGYALGGIAGHTGLFGTAPAMGRFARLMLQTIRGDAGLAARGASPAAFDGRGIPPGGVAPPSNIPDILGRPALPGGRLARLGATRDLHHGLLARADTIATFLARSEVPNSSRALGWDTMRPTSSCGTLMSPRAIGHTGFTGTSLWIDPVSDVYVVLLTNRVHPTRANDGILAFRPAFHDAVLRTLAGG